MTPGIRLGGNSGVAAAQRVEHLGADLGEVLDRVKADRGAAQDHQRVGIPIARPIGGELDGSPASRAVLPG